MRQETYQSRLPNTLTLIVVVAPFGSQIFFPIKSDEFLSEVPSHENTLVPFVYSSISYCSSAGSSGLILSALIVVESVNDRVMKSTAILPIFSNSIVMYVL